MSFDRVKCAEDRAENRVRDQNGNRSAHAIMQPEEAGRFQLKYDRRAVSLISHSRMQRRQDRQRYSENEDCLNETDAGAEPPRGASPRLKSCHVEKRENPAVCEVLAITTCRSYSRRISRA